MYQDTITELWYRFTIERIRFRRTSAQLSASHLELPSRLLHQGDNGGGGGGGEQGQVLRRTAGMAPSGLDGNQGRADGRRMAEVILVRV